MDFKLEETQKALILEFIGPCETIAELNCGTGEFAPALKDLCEKLYWGFDDSIYNIVSAKNNVRIPDVFFSAADVLEFGLELVFDVILVSQPIRNPLDTITKIMRNWKYKRLIFSLLVGTDKKESNSHSLVATRNEADFFSFISKRVSMEVLGDGIEFWIFEVI